MTCKVFLTLKSNSAKIQVTKVRFEGICVRLVSEKDKSIDFENFDNSHNSFLSPEYFFDFLCE